MRRQRIFIMLLTLIFVVSSAQLTFAKDVTGEFNKKTPNINANTMVYGKFEKMSDSDAYTFISGGGSYKLVIYTKTPELDSEMTDLTEQDYYVFPAEIGYGPFEYFSAVGGDPPSYQWAAGEIYGDPEMLPFQDGWYRTEIKLGNYRPSLADTILGLVGQNTTALSNTQQEYNSTFQSMKTTMLFDTYQTNLSTDWNTERYNEYKIEGNGFIIIMVNAYTSGTDSYGNIEASVRHSTDSGTTWGYDAYTKYRHDQSMSDSYDGTAITVPMAVSDEELIRATWKITKEVEKACRIKILGIGVTATQTVDGGAL